MSDRDVDVGILTDRLIASLDHIRFWVTERLRLRYARIRGEKKHSNLPANPLVSICIPTYNRGPLLIERAITSILAQTYRNFEIIVVGDHCTDNTAELLARIPDPRIRFTNLPNRTRSYRKTIENHWYVGGAIPANRALQLARGDWIARIDDDDTWTVDHIEKLLAFAVEGNYEFVSGSYMAERFGHRYVVRGKTALDPYYTRRPSVQHDTSPRIGGVSTWLYRSYLRFMPYNVNCWRKSWNRVWDIDLSMRFYSAGVRMGYLEEVLSEVYPRPGEETIGLDAYKLSEQVKLKLYDF